jgi:hypothetical protein
LAAATKLRSLAGANGSPISSDALTRLAKSGGTLSTLWAEWQPNSTTTGRKSQRAAERAQIQSVRIRSGPAHVREDGLQIMARRRIGSLRESRNILNIHRHPHDRDD